MAVSFCAGVEIVSTRCSLVVGAVRWCCSELEGCCVEYDGSVVGWERCWMGASLDGSVVGWERGGMGALLDGSIVAMLMGE